MKRQCSKCPGTEFRRINRAGFFERRVLTLLGYFPWECAECRRRSYLKAEGHGKRKADSQA